MLASRIDRDVYSIGIMIFVKLAAKDFAAIMERQADCEISSSVYACANPLTI
jgi:hypothetical protein